MRLRMGTVFVSAILFSCGSADKAETPTPRQNPIMGTWQLLTGTIIEKGDTTVTDYTKNVSFIKIINESHFAFLDHDLKKGRDSAAAVFVAGGGRYSLVDSLYTEHLEYCTARNWEGNDFTFTITIKGDTLVQRGMERVESAGINRENIEKYVRVKK